VLLSPTQAGKVNSVGVASHWPCVIDDSGISTELTTYRKVDEPPTNAAFGYGRIYYLKILPENLDFQHERENGRRVSEWKLDVAAMREIFTHTRGNSLQRRTEMGAP